MRVAFRFVLSVGLGLSVATPGVAQQPARWQWTSGDLTLRANLDAQAWVYLMRGTWWNLAAGASPAFDADRSFGELWVHPKLAGTFALGAVGELYGGLSAGLARTLAADPFDVDGEGAARVENAFVGLRGGRDGGLRHDVSFGRQPFTLGTGMLLTAGSGNGSTWGAAASAPRKAWGRTAIGRLGIGEVTGQVFQLEPAEVPDARTDTRIRGASVEWVRAASAKAGLGWLTVPRSTAIYPGDLAPLVFIENGRAGLDTWHGWLDATGLVPGLPALGVRAEFAHQRNHVTRADGRRDPMKAQAWLVGASYRAPQWWLAPKFSLHVARFSGDDPATPTYERFDPLYWGNGLDNWWFGANGAYAWLNSNVRLVRFIVDAYASPQDILQFQFVRASADRLGSAVQYGQGVRFGPGGLAVGVPAAHLSNEFYLQYARVVSPSLVALAFVSHSLPGDGLKAVAPRGARPWTTVGAGLSATF